MCGCKGKVTTKDCANLTVSLIQVYLDAYECVEDGNFYTQLDLSIAFVNSRITMLTAALADKTSDPKSCSYYDVITNEVRKEYESIFQSGLC